MTPGVLTVSVTERGRAIAASLPYPRSHGALAATVRANWQEGAAFVIVAAVGVAVRVVAPLLSDKRTDPVVVCVDDEGRFVVPVTGGHRRSSFGLGANGLAREVASLLGATPVITTATDATASTALDQLDDFAAEGDLASVTAAIIDGDRPRLENPLGWPLPLRLADRVVTANGGATEAVSASPPVTSRPPSILVTDEVVATGPGIAVLRPRSLVAGIGSSTDAPAAEVADALATALSAAGLSRASLHMVATIDRRSAEPGIVALGLPICSFPAAELAAVDVPHPSAVVESAVGTPSVAEAAAILAAGPGAILVAEKRATPHTTVAIARRSRPEGRLAVVGLGPGGAASRTLEAATAVRHAEIVIGFSGYIDQCGDLLHPSKTVIASPIGAEVERARLALSLADEGRSVAVVCSGDPGVYAMASLVLEEAGALAATRACVDCGRSAAGSTPVPLPRIEIVPGVTAALAAAAVLGAPLGHDHLVLSLSDLLTPWQLIKKRAEAARDADLVLVLYNPRSAKRHWQLGAIRQLLLERRPPGTPVGIVTDAGRPGAAVTFTTLGGLDPDLVGMTTCVIIGSSATRLLGGWMVTPRGYARC